MNVGLLRRSQYLIPFCSVHEGPSVWEYQQLCWGVISYKSFINHKVNLNLNYAVVRRALRSYGYSYSLLSEELRSYQEFPNHIVVRGTKSAYGEPVPRLLPGG